MHKNEYDEDKKDIWLILFAVMIGMTFFLLMTDVIIKLTK